MAEKVPPQFFSKNWNIVTGTQLLFWNPEFASLQRNSVHLFFMPSEPINFDVPLTRQKYFSFAAIPTFG